MIQELQMEFCSLDGLYTDTTLRQTEKYVPDNDEMEKIKKFAEEHDSPGVVKLSGNDKTFIVCSKTYNYRDGSEPALMAVFNAEIVFVDDVKYFDITPEFTLSLNFEDSALSLKLPIHHAYYRHILWQDELEDVLDLLDQAVEAIDDDLLEDNDDDYEVCIWC